MFSAAAIKSPKKTTEHVAMLQKKQNHADEHSGIEYLGHVTELPYSFALRPATPNCAILGTSKCGNWARSQYGVITGATSVSCNRAHKDFENFRYPQHITPIHVPHMVELCPLHPISPTTSTSQAIRNTCSVLITMGKSLMLQKAIDRTCVFF